MNFRNSYSEQGFDYEKLRPRNMYSNFIKFLKETPAEIAILGVTGLTAGLIYGHHLESVREHKIPLSFSEISQIKRDAERVGQELSPRVLYLTALNDLNNKIFEASNDSYANTPFGSRNNNFARELEMKLDKSFKFHKHDINDLLKALPNYSAQFLQGLETHIQVANKLGPVRDLFEKSWEDRHMDVDKTEVYTDTEYYTDSKGNSQSRTVTKTRQVYDYTIHSYDYFSSNGNNASTSLDNLLKTYPQVEYKEKVRLTSKTNAEGEMAAEVSRQKEGEYLKLGQVELFNIVNNWHYGSTLETNLSRINSNFAQLTPDANNWRVAKNKARSTTYRTYSHSDSGPVEFQVVETTKSYIDNFRSNVYEIVNGVNYVSSNIGNLENKIKELIAVELDRKSGDSDALVSEIMQTAFKMHKLNFKEGFEVEMYRPLVVAGLAILGLIFGGLIGFGLDYSDRKYSLYEKILLK